MCAQNGNVCSHPAACQVVESNPHFEGPASGPMYGREDYNKAFLAKILQIDKQPESYMSIVKAGKILKHSSARRENVIIPNTRIKKAQTFHHTTHYHQSDGRAAFRLILPAPGQGAEQ